MFVSAGDINSDSTQDIITGEGAAPDSEPRIRAFSGKDGAPLLDFLAFESSFHGGVRVAAVDVTGNGRIQIIAARGPGSTPEVKVFRADAHVMADVMAFDQGDSSGVSVTTAWVKGFAFADIVASDGTGQVRVICNQMSMDDMMMQNMNDMVDLTQWGVPSFTAADPPTVIENTGAHTVANFISDFSPGAGPTETNQTVLGYTVSNVSNPNLFSVLPHVASDGTLTYALAPAVSGSTTFDVTVQDNGGTADGHGDTSTAQTFTLTVMRAQQLSVQQEHFVQALYLDTLGRTGLQAEVDGWVKLLTGPGGSQRLVATAIENTPEAREHLVKSWYSAYLGRQAAGDAASGRPGGFVHTLSFATPARHRSEPATGEPSPTGVLMLEPTRPGFHRTRVWHPLGEQTGVPRGAGAARSTEGTANYLLKQSLVVVVAGERGPDQPMAVEI